MADNDPHLSSDGPEELTRIAELAVRILNVARGSYGTKLNEYSPGNFSTAQADGQSHPIVEQHSGTPLFGQLHHRIWVGRDAMPLPDVDHAWAHCSYDFLTGVPIEAEIGWTGDESGKHMVSILIGKYWDLVPQLESYAHLHTHILPQDSKGWSMIVACSQELVEQYRRSHGGEMSVQSAVDILLSNAPEHAPRMLDALETLRTGVFDDTQPA